MNILTLVVVGVILMLMAVLVGSFVYNVLGLMKLQREMILCLEDMDKNNQNIIDIYKEMNDKLLASINKMAELKGDK